MEIISDNRQFNISTIGLIGAYTSSVKVIIGYLLIFCLLLSENYYIIIVVSGIAPGLDTLVKLCIPDQTSNKVTFSFLSL